MEKTPNHSSPYQLDGKIPLKQAIPLGLQHVLAMFVGNLSPLLITKEPLDGRNASIVAVSLGLGFGVGSATAVQAFMPQWLKYVFGGSGIVPAAIIAILLNIILPKDRPKIAEVDEKPIK